MEKEKESPGLLETKNSSGVALLPLVLFLLLFLGTGIWLTTSGVEMAFYQLSAAVAILPAIIFSILLGREKLDRKIATFLGGVGQINIITMCMIYLLAGAFASVAKSIGGVEATVNMGLAFIPPAYILPGLFLITSFVATAMGTSMGTIAAIAPIAVGIADQTGMSAGVLMGTVLGGAMFGDNLSMISDTTIAATRTQGCELSDKFRMNLLIAAPAALIALALLFVFGGGATPEPQTGDWDFLRIFPYLLILVLAVAGINVFVVLTLGILLCGVVGFWRIPDYSLLSYAGDIYKGFTGMQEILILSMLIGGLGELIRTQGGLQWLLERVSALSTKLARGNRRLGGEAGISGLVALADVCTANNTVAIIISSRLAREIAEKSGVSPRRAASLLDIFSCVVQGLIPYAAQVLLAGSIARISPLQVSVNNWYCWVLLVVSLVAVLVGRPAGVRKTGAS